MTGSRREADDLNPLMTCLHCPGLASADFKDFTEMKTVLIIGAGSVARVVAHLCSQIFDHCVLASRTLDKCEIIRQAVLAATGKVIETLQVDAEHTHALVGILKQYNPSLVVHVALPYQNLSIMRACLEAGCHYLDTANHESRDELGFEYSQQWALGDAFASRGLMAVLGCGFDPGVTGVFARYASNKGLLDETRSLDIIDCNDGDHGKPFATNFNLEINLREITLPGKHFENAKWWTTAPFEISRDIEYPEIGTRKSYLIFHEELESLHKHFPDIGRLRFWMTFSEDYLTHLRVLENVGLTSIDPVVYQGQSIVPLQFLKSLLPDPASLAENYVGSVCIGCVFSGVKKGKNKSVVLFCTCSHRESFQRTGANAVAFTTGLPASVGARMIKEGNWKGTGVFNVEQLDPDPFLSHLAKGGLGYKVQEVDPSPWLA